MNREIKFRVFNGIEMITDVVVGRFGAFYVNPDNNGLDVNDSASLTPFNTKYHESTIVMQFTGLHDKNGKEIYEGDVCSFVYDHIGNVWIMSVEWNNTEARFVLRYNSNFVSLDEADFEVIGNIYENPELLKP